MRDYCDQGRNHRRLVTGSAQTMTRTKNGENVMLKTFWDTTGDNIDRDSELEWYIDETKSAI